MEERAQDGPRPQAREVRALFEALLHVVEVRAFSAQDGDFRMTPLRVSLSSCASSCNSNCRATVSNSSLLGSTSEIHTTARGSRLAALASLNERCPLAFLPSS